MGREIMIHEPFDSSIYEGVRKNVGRFSYYGTLRILQVSTPQVIRLVRDGFVDGNLIDTRAGLTVGQLHHFHNTIKDLRQKGVIKPKPAKEK